MGRMIVQISTLPVTLAFGLTTFAQEGTLPPAATPVQNATTTSPPVPIPVQVSDPPETPAPGKMGREKRRGTGSNRGRDSEERKAEKKKHKAERKAERKTQG